MSSSMTVHVPGSKRVTLGELEQMETIAPMGRLHKPIPHHVLAHTIIDQVADRGWEVIKRQFAVGRKGALLFGVLDLKGPASMRINDEDGTTSSFGFRSSTNQTFAIRGVAGQRVWICDNLCMSGDMFVMQHKLTIRLNLDELVSRALNLFIKQTDTLLTDMNVMRQTAITDREAKVRLFDVFNKGALPLHMFDDVSQLYFRPQAEHIDCQPRTVWGLHNACTRAVKLLKPARQFTAGVDLGRLFNLATPQAMKNITPPATAPVRL